MDYQQARQAPRSQGQTGYTPSEGQRGDQPRLAPHRQQQHGQENKSSWPLRDDGDAQPGASHPQKSRPKRPPRPDQMSQLPVAVKAAGNRGPRIPQYIPQYRQDTSPPVKQYAQPEPIPTWTNELSPAYPSPDPSRPLTGSSYASSSSAYSVPDFPIPQVPQPVQQQVRRPPLGPPPSARRGPASYFPQPLYVTPIAEESDSQRTNHDSKSSFASSNAIPIGIPQHYLDRQQQEPQVDNRSPFDDQLEDADMDDFEISRLMPVRQASIGRRSVPTLTTIKNSDVRPDSQTRPLAEARSVRESGPSVYNDPVPDINFPLPEPSPPETLSEKSAPPLLSSRTNSSDLLGKASASVSTDPEKSMHHQPPSQELSSEQSAGDAKKAGFSITERPNTLAQRVGSRRPPRLDVDVVREAEARGSLTSLPDLIRRATKVATNLDRGRTASRLGMNWFEEDLNRRQSLDKRRSGSLSDILASFPPPGLATPPGSKGSRMMPWPSHLRHTSLPSESDPGEFEKPSRKKCCGMPMWLFITLLIIAILLIAAAVVIPVVLVVLPRQHSPNSVSASALASCQKSLICENGGTNIVGSDGSCSCLCVNGFAGTKCAESSSASCTTTNVGSVNNVTLGDSIPRLLSGAQSNFSVPLNATNVLGLFSSLNLSCTSENALVYFNGLSARSIAVESIKGPRELGGTGTGTGTGTINRRADSTSGAAAVATSNGIVFQSGSPTETSLSSTPTTSSSSLSTTASSSSAYFSSNTTTVDFARVAVLLVLQESGQLKDATNAQENLQDYFTSGATGHQVDASNIDLGAGYSINLEQYSVQMANGTVVGG